MIREYSLPDLTKQAWIQAIALLFKPFRLNVWLKLCLIILLSGYVGGFGGELRSSLKTAHRMYRIVTRSSATSSIASKQAKAALPETEQKDRWSRFLSLTYTELQQQMSRAKSLLTRHPILSVFGFLVFFNGLFVVSLALCSI